MLKRSPALVLAAAVASLLVAPHIAMAANSTPAIAAFDAAFAKTSQFTYKLRAHETKGSSVQDRLYDYSFMKPHFAKTLIESGDGKGSGAVWAGGDQVSGHQGGFLAGIHLKISLHDGRAVSLRGYTIPDGLPQNIIEKYTSVPGKLSQAPGGKIDGVPTDRVELVVATPATNDGISEQIIYLSQVTHFPLRQILYAGSQVVLDQSFLDWNFNPGLTANDFPF